MKKSRIFMGASALVLAIAGIAATKATSKFVTYYYQQSAQVCSPVTATCDGGDFNCTATIGGVSRQLFTTISLDNKTCSNAAKKSN